MSDPLATEDSISKVDGSPDRLAEPVGAENPPRLPFPVVGIGASAGGLEAFIEFFTVMPPDSGMAFVLIQHLFPDRESMVAEILGRSTKMPVLQVVNGQKVEPNHVYVIRPGNTLTLDDGVLHLGAPLEQRGHQRPVDDFFRSLAEDQRERAIAVVMSGMGSNGTAGARAIKAVGGVCVAQEPDSAKFPSMPRSLIDAGLADFVLRVEEIPAWLMRYASHPYVRDPHAADAAVSREKHSFDEIIGLLRTRSRHDFTGYKTPTLARRIERRMGLNQISAMVDYSRLLKRNPAELIALSDDMMIHVTGFFRDPECWLSLRDNGILPLMAERENGAPIRAWVTACSSGEEAYTLAILLVEAAGLLGKKFDIKIFATDTAERSLAQARAGVYPGGIESEISPERLAAFFTQEDAVYRVKRELRECVVFAPQNVLQDPPFSRLDFCTCRNLLIYLEPELQRRALGLLHFGLTEGGFLLLGNSETIGGSEDLFEVVDRKARVYRRTGPTRYGRIEFSKALSSLGAHLGNPQPAPATTSSSVEQLTEKALLDHYTPAAVVIDREQHIVFFHGQTERFLDQPRGNPTLELFTLAREPVRGALRTAVQNAIADTRASVATSAVVEGPAGRHRIEVTATPLDGRSDPGYFLVCFLERPEPAKQFPLVQIAGGNGDQPLEEELQRIRDELQSTIRELQSNNEELRVSHEEATSINEELQSSNEELETSKEELQSLNEELTTANTQLQAKMEQLETATNDLNSLLSSTDIAVIFLDPQFRIRQFTPAVKDLIEVIPADVGRPLSDLARKFRDDQLVADAETVLEKLVPIEKEVVSKSGRSYVRRVLPYRTADNRIEGVVMTFVDITERKRAQTALTASEERHRLILESVKEYAIFMLDVEGRIATWSAGAEHILGYSQSEAIGHPLDLIVPPEEREAGLPGKEFARARETGSVQQECWHQRKNGNRFWGSGLLSALRGPDGELLGFVKVLRDNTERKLTEEALQQAKRAAEIANEAKDQFLATVSHELRTPLSSILLWSRLLEDQDTVAPDQLAEALAAIKRGVEEQSDLIEDLVDIARIVSGKLRLELKATELVSIVHAGVAAAAAMAKEKDVALEELLDPAAGTVEADGSRLQQVVSNLVHNAVKFTPPGGRVRTELRRKGDQIEIQVTDTGIGIEPSFLPQVFDRFAQAEAGSSRSHTGLGLGLNIAKQIIETHGGGIEAESEGKGRGSAFTVRLPLPLLQNKSANALNGAKAQLAHLLEGRRVLLVEDSPGTRRAMVAVLHEAGAVVAAVDSAPAAWKEFERERPDILVSDLGLPTIDGYSLIAHIRKIERSMQLAAVPAVALTAFAGSSVNRKALESGFDCCITKPIEPVRLVSTLASMTPPAPAK